MEKSCAACKVTKDLISFPRSKYAKDGRFSRCRPCNSLRNKKWRDLAPHKKRQYELKKKFGMSLDQYNQLFISQNGACAICHVHQSQLKKAMAVDHSHETGDIRGLLCHNCNVGLGNFQDSCALLNKANDYLNRTAFTGLKAIAGGAN